MQLPKIVNINPRGAMNKLDELKTFIVEEEVDVAFVSESHDRDNFKLQENLSLSQHEIFSNLDQRKEKGGRPAIIVNNVKYVVENLTNTLVDIPWGVEMMWVMLTLRNSTSSSIIQNIVLGCIYCKPNSKKKSVLLDHIAQTYNFLSSKYGRGLYWLLAGDTNDLNLDPILSLSPNLQSVVKTPTRLNPDRILDNIITDM